jgi:protein-tyrosine phosphatase
LGFFDLHSHVLAGLDDGAPDADTSLRMLRALADIGFDTVVATPHQKLGQFLPDLGAIRLRFASTQATIAAAGLAISLRLAAENMWDAVFFERASAAPARVPSYDDGPAFLFELPLAVPLPTGLFEQLFRLRLRGHLPVVAHPERYAPLWDDPDALAQLGQTAALVVDLGALAGHHGRQQAKFARRVVAEGLVHAVASDAHTPNDVRIAAEGIAWIRKKLGDRAVTRLLDDNPRRIAAGELPDE